jgi:NAD-dependent dihydropyrimidine dehydrogenase PreA subunit
MTALGYLHQRGASFRPVGVDALCPFGGLESLASLVTSGLFLQRVAMSSLIALGIVLVTAFVFRRAFCGRICPLGTLQEIFGTLGVKLLGRRMTPPPAVDAAARYLKYVVLVVVLWLTWRTGTLVIRPYDPWVAYQHITSAELLAEFGIGTAVLGISLLGSIVYDRFFCKYLCPMGAFLGLTSKLSVFKIHRDAEACIDCGRCDTACPVNLTVSDATAVTSAECIDCGECVAACPASGALATAAAGSRAPLGPVAAALLPVGLVTVLATGATVTGDLSWRMETLRERSAAAAAAAGLPESSVAFDPALIKGSTTVAEITDAAEIPPDAFEKVFGIPVARQGEQLKVLKAEFTASPGEVRGWVALYLLDPVAAMEYVPTGAHADEGH